MKILRAVHLGMCFGVRDAIALAHEHADAGPLTILGDLVHNPTVLSGLEAKGIAIAQDVADVRTPTVMVTAHGTSERNLARTRALGLTVVEATCPLVTVAHRAVATLAREGYHVVIVGQRDHVEVRGLTGDLDRFDVVLDDADVLALEAHPRIGVAAQTTQPAEKVRHVAELIRRRFPRSDVRVIDTVCKPTKQRQSAAVEMAQQADVVIVVGGRSSNNTRELVRTCARYCARVHHVQSAADVRPEWFDGAEVVGLTAGTSTPDDVIDRVAVQIRLMESGLARPGPGSISLQINREMIVVAGWARAILLQFAHPAIAAAVRDHSSFRGGILPGISRLRSTVGAMLAIAFGDTEQMIDAAARINAIHDRVRNADGADETYSAHDPELQRWVHATLLESIPLTYERFVAPLTDRERDHYCAEAAIMEPLLGMPAGSLPRDTAEVDAYMREMLASDAITVNDTSRTLARALLFPPRWQVAWPVFRALQVLTIGSLPPSIREAYGFEWRARDARAFTRWTMALRTLLRVLPPIARQWPMARPRDLSSGGTWRRAEPRPYSG
jgi:4-hydroxy-3-methylbut-2-enyl diphosphate reductase